jgi:hypothetical protein
MNDLEKNKGAGLKYALFIGIPVIIVLGVLGAYYQMTNPLTILSKTINTAYKQIDSMLIPSSNDFNLNENPLSVQGNLSFTTDLELNGLEDFQKYNYDINIDMDLKQEFVSLKLGMNDNDKNIISGNFYQIGDNQYLESKTLIDKILKMPNQEQSFSDLFDFTDLKSNSSILTGDAKYLLKKLKDSFDNTLNKKYLSREKTDITINGRQIKTTKITYILNEENQQKTVKKIANDLINDQKSLEILAELLNTSVEEIKDNLEKDWTYTNDYSIVLYTEGWNQNIVRISLLENNIEQLTFLNFNEEQSIHINNDLIINIKSFEKEKLEMEFTEKSSNINGTIKINSEEKNKNEYKNYIFLKLNSSDINLEINLDLNTQTNTTIEKPNTTNAQDINSLTPSEIGTILENLENALKDTFLLDLFENNIM